jgi:uncharacterized membrane protein (DUF373 family)
MDEADESHVSKGSGWTRFVKSFELVIVKILMVLLMIVVAVTAIELAWLLVKDLTSIREVALDVEEMLDLFGYFLMVFIGVELLTTLKTYVDRGMVHGEVVLEVALIALAQKVIVLDFTRAGPLSVLGMAALVLALAAAFWWVRGGARWRTRK